VAHTKRDFYCKVHLSDNKRKDQVFRRWQTESCCNDRQAMCCDPDPRSGNREGSATAGWQFERRRWRLDVILSESLHGTTTIGADSSRCDGGDERNEYASREHGVGLCQTWTWVHFYQPNPTHQTRVIITKIYISFVVIQASLRHKIQLAATVMHERLVTNEHE